MSASQSLNTAQFIGSTGQTLSQDAQNVNNQGQNQNNGQGPNSNNGQGPNSNNGVGPGVNNNGPNQNNGVGPNQNNGQGPNSNNGVGPGVNNQGQDWGPQGQNALSRGQRNGDIFQTMLKNAREERLSKLANGSRTSQTPHEVNQKAPATPQELRARLSQLIYDMLTARFSKLKYKPHQFTENIDDGRGFDFFNRINFAKNFESLGGAAGIASIQRAQGLDGLNFESFRFEEENVSYQANGVIHTADGRTINVDVNMQMSRQFVSYMNISTDVSRLVDPLVINYGGTAASLLGEKFQFDLTMNGEMNEISVLAEGSGYLAIDRNGDGKINDGSELFGPSTGCGFNELRKYDTDGNGWIDENDEIFDKLVVWNRDKDGNDVIYTLKELGIGAIFLGDISTKIYFKDEKNETLGVMRSTSFFLKQCGGAGTLSHIDLAL